MTIAIISDTHVGARSSSSIFREYTSWWYHHVFFPTLRENKVKVIFHLGDFFDSRNAISLLDIDFVINFFAKKLIDEDVKFYITLGNHDVAFKNTNRVHSLFLLKAAAPDHVVVIEEPTMVSVDGQDFALIPWINSSNYEDTMKFLNGIVNKKSTIVGGHFEIAGMKMYKNSSVCEHGLDASIFKEFKEVWSGHFHHISQNGNVKYIGSAFYITWQDYNDDRGFHLFDNKKGLVFVKNEHCLFYECVYDEDVFKTLTDDEYRELFEGKFVRLQVLNEGYNKVLLMDTQAKINRAKPHDLQIINGVMMAEDVEIVNVDTSTHKSTLDYIKEYVEKCSYIDSIKVKMESLYTRATDKMTKGE